MPKNLFGLKLETELNNRPLKSCLPKLVFVSFLMEEPFYFTKHTAVSTKVVQLKSIKAYATLPKGMMGCGCSLLHRQVHEFSARWKAVL